MSLFPFSDYWSFYAIFTLFVFVVLLLDLGVFHRKAHEVSVKEASVWTFIWIGLALLFNLFLYWYAKHKFLNNEALLGLSNFDPEQMARQVGVEFLTGYVIEKSLAVDNIFVFAVVFSYFGIPKIYQHRILFYGIIGALLFRGLFIILSAYLMAYHGVVVLFGILLMITGIKMFFAGDQMMDPEKNILLKLLRKIFYVHPKIEEDKFFFKKEGILYATPLFVGLVFIECTDIIFAIDSVPAIFAITKEPLIVFTSNIFAILGLRSMYFMLSGVMDRFKYIKFGLAGVLIFVGLKMVWLNPLYDGKFPVVWSLGIIVGLIGLSVLFSLYQSRKI